MYIGEEGGGCVGGGVDVWGARCSPGARFRRVKEKGRGHKMRPRGKVISSIGECVLVGGIGTAPRNVPHRYAIRYGKAEKVGAEGDFPVQKRLGCFC